MAVLWGFHTVWNQFQINWDKYHSLTVYAFFFGRNLADDPAVLRSAGLEMRTMTKSLKLHVYQFTESESEEGPINILHFNNQR